MAAVSSPKRQELQEISRTYSNYFFSPAKSQGRRNRVERRKSIWGTRPVTAQMLIATKCNATKKSAGLRNSKCTSRWHIQPYPTIYPTSNLNNALRARAKALVFMQDKVNPCSTALPGGQSMQLITTIRDLNHSRFAQDMHYKYTDVLLLQVGPLVRCIPLPV